MDPAAAKLAATQNEKAFGSNFVRGAVIILVVGAILFLATLFAIEQVFKLPIFDVLSGKDTKPGDRGVVIGIIGGMCGIILIALIIFFRAQGGVRGVGADARVSGLRYDSEISPSVDRLKNEYRANQAKASFQAQKSLYRGEIKPRTSAPQDSPPAASSAASSAASPDYDDYDYLYDNATEEEKQKMIEMIKSGTV